MANPRYWNILEDFADSAWSFSDDAWKVLRWIAASAAVLAIWDQSQDVVTLVLGLGLATFAVIALSSALFKRSLRGLTDKARQDNAVVSVLLSTLLLVVSIAFAAATWAVVTAIYIAAIPSP